VSARTERGEENTERALSYRNPGIQIFWNGGDFGKNAPNLSKQFAAGGDRQFQFEKSSQLLIRSHNETLSAVAMRVCNLDCSPRQPHRVAPELLLIAEWQMIRPVGFRFLNAERFGTMRAVKPFNCFPRKGKK